MPYNPNIHTATNSSYGMGQAGPTDARSWYFDASGQFYRPYASKDEVYAYLNEDDFRQGNYSIFIREGQVINEYWFKDGITDDKLVLKETGAAPPPVGQRFAVLGEDDSYNAGDGDRIFYMFDSTFQFKNGRELQFSSDIYGTLVSITSDRAGAGQVIIEANAIGTASFYKCGSIDSIFPQGTITLLFPIPNAADDPPRVIPVSVNGKFADPEGNIMVVGGAAGNSGAIQFNAGVIDGAGVLGGDDHLVFDGMLKVLSRVVFAGEFWDATWQPGTDGQVLSTQGGMVRWINAPGAGATENLQQTLDAGATLTKDNTITVSAGKRLFIGTGSGNYINIDAASNEITVGGRILLDETVLIAKLVDGQGDQGAAGMVLSSTGTGTQWVPGAATENLQQTLDAGATLNKNNTIAAAGFNLKLHQGSFTIESADGTGTVSFPIPGNVSYAKAIAIDQVNMRISLANGNSDSGGMQRTSQGFGELRIFSGKQNYGANNFDHSYITLYTGDCNFGVGGTAPTGTQKQRVSVNGMGQVGIGVTTVPTDGHIDAGIDPSAALQVNSVPTSIVSGTNVWQQNNPYTGFLPPRMTTTQRDQIVNPAAGLMIYNNTTVPGAINFYDGAAWKTLSGT